MKKYLLIYLFFGLYGCGLFTTREAEDPDQSRSNFQPAYDKEQVIKNFSNSLIDKNVENYLLCFVDTLFTDRSYKFLASSEAISLYQIFTQDWSINEEKRYLTSVFNKIPSGRNISLTLSNENYSSLGPDSIIYSASYFLSLPLQSGSSIPGSYAGNLQFNMLRDSRSRWVIYLWKDIKGESLPSWSELKGSLY